MTVETGILEIALSMSELRKLWGKISYEFWKIL